jgi:hypothetical protein
MVVLPPYGKRIELHFGLRRPARDRRALSLRGKLCSLSLVDVSEALQTRAEMRRRGLSVRPCLSTGSHKLAIWDRLSNFKKPAENLLVPSASKNQQAALYHDRALRAETPRTACLLLAFSRIAYAELGLFRIRTRGGPAARSVVGAVVARIG